MNEYQTELAYEAAKAELSLLLALMEDSLYTKPEAFSDEKRDNWTHYIRLSRLMMEECEHQLIHRAATNRELREQRLENRLLRERNEALAKKVSDMKRSNTALLREVDEKLSK